MAICHHKNIALIDDKWNFPNANMTNENILM